MAHGGWLSAFVGAAAALVIGAWLVVAWTPAGAAPAIQDAEVTLAPLADLPPEALGRRFGALRLEAAVELKPTDPNAGGFSALQLSVTSTTTAGPDARQLTLLTDTAQLLTLDLSVSDLLTSDLQTVTGAAHSLADGAGRALVGKHEADSEGLARLPLNAGRACVLVSFERTHAVAEHCRDASDDAWRRTQITPLPPTDILGDNQGLEGLATIADDLVLAGGELPTLNGAHPIWALTPTSQGWTFSKGPRFGVRTPGLGYGLTGLEPAPDGGLFVLFRQWIPTEGNSAVLGHISGAQIADALAAPVSDAPFSHPKIAPQTLLRMPAGGDLPTDNFEGVAAETTLSGDVLMWLAADDNFRDQQRSLLYVFRWGR